MIPLNLSKPRRKPRHLEDDLQMRVCDFLARFSPSLLFYAVPNGGLRNLREAGRLKRMGVKAGVADLHFLLPGVGPSEHGVGVLGVIELKIKPNRPTPEQEKFLKDVRAGGGCAAVCYSLEDTVDTLESWGVKFTARLVR